MFTRIARPENIFLADGKCESIFGTEKKSLTQPYRVVSMTLCDSSIRGRRILA